MTRLILALALVAVMTIVSYQPGVAQPAPVRRGDKTIEFSRERTIETSHAFGECLVRRRKPNINDLLNTPPGSVLERQIFLKISKGAGQCLLDADKSWGEVTLRYQPIALRGPVAEALFERDFKDFRPVAKRQAVATFDMVEAVQQRGSALTELEASGLVMLEFAECVLQSRPAESLALLRTKVATEAESGALWALAPSFSPCLSSGKTSTINRTILRGLIAEAAYRSVARAPGALQQAQN